MPSRPSQPSATALPPTASNITDALPSEPQVPVASMRRQGARNLAWNGRVRPVIEVVTPAIGDGRYAIKRIVGEPVDLDVVVISDGHDHLNCRVLYRHESEISDLEHWAKAPLRLLHNDHWLGSFTVTRLGTYYFTVQAWVDHFKTWQQGLSKKLQAGQDVRVDVLIGAEIAEEAATRIEDITISDQLTTWSQNLRAAVKPEVATALALDVRIAAIIAAHPDPTLVATYSKELAVTVERERARFSAWYEMFPRSFGNGRHGRFKDTIALLPYVAAMGFDVLYFPPIHPIGETFRKGRNNALTAAPGEPGSPWAVGGVAGGHKSVHPDLGTLEDFTELVARAREFGLEVALDMAFQASPDHPYVKEHPEWFKHRPDGTIQYAENPPKKYQDIYPFDFEGLYWRELWDELKSVFSFWIDRGVHIFRVDNPHTKPFAFWRWVLAELRLAHPEVIFLSEAFTRPHMMYHLAKIGFSQSYTYFTWRLTKRELTDYFTELTQSNVIEYFRPNLWPNTPDILPEHLQTGGRSAFMQRLVLAATLAANYGIYGPAFELCDHHARVPGSEEYANSEKYQLRQWNVTAAESLAPLIGRINRIRRENPALHADRSLRFHPVDNDFLIAYSKKSGDNLILTIVNLDPHHKHVGTVDLDLAALELAPSDTFQVHDLVSDNRYLWQGARNYVELDPREFPAHIFRVRKKIRSEKDFEYFL